MKASIAVSVLASATALSGPAVAQGSAGSYPNKPVTVVIAFSAGGSTDNESRLYTDKLQKYTGQPFVYDYRPGAAGSIGLGHVLNSKPDGYTLFLANSGLTVFTHFYPEFRPSVIARLEPIVELSNRSTAVISSVKALPDVHDLKGLVAYAKANPGTLNCNDSGAGGITHMVCISLASALGIKILPVHYKGVAAGQADLMAGRTQVSAGTLFYAMKRIKVGGLRPLAIISPNKRSALMPELKTAAEQGYKLEYPSWLGAFAPPDTPDAIVRRANALFNRALKEPDVVKRLESVGSFAVGGTPEEFHESYTSQMAYWGDIIEDNDIKLQ